MFEDTYKHKGKRNQLVRELELKGIQDTQVLKAIQKVPRHLFMDSAFESHAYQDKAFGIGEGQTISQPFTVAIQSSLLSVEPGLKVLEVGTGSGYQAAILMELGVRLFTIEYNRVLFQRSRKLLGQLGFQPFSVCGDGSLGLKPKAPFARIIVTAGAPSVPKALIEQLEIGGMLVIPVGDEFNQKMVRLIKISEKQIKKEEHGDFAFVKLLGKQGWQTEK